MIGYRFYEELGPGRRPRGTVLAILVESARGDMYDAIAAVFDRPDSPVASTTVQDLYLRRRCRRLPERRARDIHPTLFQHIERTHP